LENLQYSDPFAVSSSYVFPPVSQMNTDLLLASIPAIVAIEML